MRQFSHLVLLAGLVVLAAGPGLGASAAADDDTHTEAEPTLPAAELVMPALLAGPGYRVEPQARVHGYQARFVLHTDWGSLEAESAEMLAIRISEIPALDAVFTAEVTGLLAATAQESVMAPIRAVGNVIMNPIDSVVGLPLGTARFFGQRITRWTRRAQKLGDRIDGHLSHDGDPFRDPDGPMGATRLEAVVAERAWWEKPTREFTRLVRGEVGYRRARLELAERLGIDPYSSNPILAERLDRLAWMTASGGFASRQLVALGTAGFGEALGYTRDLERLVLRETPENLRERNRDVLTSWCSDEDLVHDFLTHGVFTPTLQTAFSGIVEALEPASGCESLLEVALMAGSEVEVRFVLNALRLVQHYAGEDAAGGRVVAQGAMLAFLTPRGELLLPMPVDLLSWLPQIRDWFERAALGPHENRTLLVSGRISDQAQRMLTQRSWSLVAHVPYPGAPPYPASPSAPGGTAPR